MNNYLNPDSGDSGVGRGETETTAPAETDVQQLRFPEDVPDDVKTAVLNYKPPDKYTISRIHNVKTKPSFICFYGVRCHEMVDGKRKNWYKCMATHKCRSNPKLHAMAASTTGATEHLKIHKIMSPTSAGDQQK